MSQIDISNLCKSYGKLDVLNDINILIREGEFLTLVGPSGCGKSTLIRTIAGLEQQTSGTISVGGSRIDHLRPHERRLSMVFQSYALYPHMSVFDNIALPLTIEQLHLFERLPLLKYLSPRRPTHMRAIGQQVGAVAAQLKIEHLLARKPSQLSGGQRQRVALGRAMVRKPIAFLMDEPLSNLDAKLRVHMRTELTDLHRRMGTTFIYVTHDQIEAMTMSDRVAMMGGGRVQQLGTPSELYARPANLEVARFIGSPTINTIQGQIGSDGRVEIRGVSLGISAKLPPGSRVTIGIRPEGIQVASRDYMAGERSEIRARLHRMENLGAERLYHFDLFDEPETVFTCRTATPIASLSDGGEAKLTFDGGSCHIFDEHGERVEHAFLAYTRSA